jgi:TusA-related sulfurtransferase
VDSAAAVAIDAGDLPLGGGFLSLLRPALALLPPGGVVAIRSTCASVRQDLPSWCRVERHEWLGAEEIEPGTVRHLVVRGKIGVPREAPEIGMALARGSRFASADVAAAVPFPPKGDVHSGFAPRGAQVEPGGPAFPYTLVERDRAAPPEVAALYDQAVAAQWDGARDIPWTEIGRHPPALERAISQIMTFLAENELSALYVPSRFVARLHPAYLEVAMFLATQINDEARHADVFLKRARAGGQGVGISTVTTSRSLLSLLELEDFTEASFLLSVLGEGTFLDLLRFVEDHAPDDCTREIARRTRVDETRHVHFGLSHVRHALSADPTLYGRLELAVRRRAATLSEVSGVPAPVQDALTVIAARGTDPAAIARGHERFRELLHDMHDHRLRRLTNAGFTASQAQTLSDLHTPNFM